MIYRSKKVWWGALLFVAPALAGMIGGVVLIIPAFLSATPGSVRVPLAIGGVVLFATCAILPWSYLSASYEVTRDELIVRFGPFRLRYQLSSIAEVIPARAPLARATPSLNFATSWDLVYIRFRRPDGRVAGLPLAISPANKTEFLRELAERVPGLGGRGEGANDDTTRLER
jgi:hypothetical protein